MVKEQIKGFIGLLIATPLAGAAITTTGNVFAGLGGGLQGIGRATQSLTATGLLTGAANLFKIKK